MLGMVGIPAEKGSSDLKLGGVFHWAVQFLLPLITGLSQPCCNMAEIVMGNEIPKNKSSIWTQHHLSLSFVGMFLIEIIQKSIKIMVFEVGSILPYISRPKIVSFL